MIFILKLYLGLVWKLPLVVVAKVYKHEEDHVNGSADHKNYGIQVSAEFEYTAMARHLLCAETLTISIIKTVECDEQK